MTSFCPSLGSYAGSQLRRLAKSRRMELRGDVGRNDLRLGAFAPEAKWVQLSCLFPARFDRLQRLFAAHSALIVGVIVGVARW